MKRAFSEWVNEQDEVSQAGGQVTGQPQPQAQDPNQSPDLQKITAALEPVGQAINQVSDEALKKQAADLYSNFWSQLSQLLQGGSKMPQSAVPQGAGQSAAPAPAPAQQ